MAKNIFNALFGTKQEHDLKALSPLLHRINEKEQWAVALSPEAFIEQSARFRTQIAEGTPLDELIPEAFALAREAGRRTLGERLYDVQILGGIVLHQGKIMEMKTGEGKTLSCVPAAYLNALTGKGVHIVTVNDYLAERDARWMEPVFNYLGLNVGTILSDLDNEGRKKAYSCDVTYGTNNEFGFDYLRDNMKWELDQKIQPKHHYCIVDEIDSILIDEARTPLIISGQADDDTKKFFDVNKIVSSLVECAKDPETDEYPDEPIGDYQLEEKSKRVTFTNEGMNSIELQLQKRNIITGSLFIDENFEYIHYVTQAVKAHRLFHIDVDYVVKEGQVQIVDEFTGRILSGRRYSDGLHQAIEAKEGIKIAKRNRTLATITFQNFFRMYDKISGMTGTADTEASEFSKIYGLEVVVIPTNRPVSRRDEHDLIYFNEGFKYQAICDEIAEHHAKGQPILVGTVSIEKSELLSQFLTKRGIKHEILNAKNHAREALIISEAGARGAITIATNMAGRGTDIKLGGNPEYRARRRCGTEASDQEYQAAYQVEYATWKDDYNEVKALGGLYIIGTERHESRRIDNQLRGRSGRQGDPGKSRFYLSLDDSLMRLFARDNLKSLMGKIGMADGEPIHHTMISNAIEKAQSKVEDRNFDIRKHLLDYDDVLNEQRYFIYDQRDAILADEHLEVRVANGVKEIVDDLTEEVLSKHKDPKSMQKLLQEALTEQFLVAPEIKTDNLTVKTKDQLVDDIAGALSKDLDGKIAQIGTERFNAFLRYQYLKQIDTKWQDHLERLEALREAVYLRSYAQKNPLLEYKLEGFDIFDSMLQEIKQYIARTAMRVQIQKKGTARYSAPVQKVSEVHNDVMQFGQSKTQSASAAAASPAQAQIKRTYPKVGRNDPCPCGSGKKYKHCHGASSQQ
ncbi:MAG: preprotein translocase subunit SecA [Spirochaetia bacterium]|nr:preprotein translocase subunit SecA [Spirochaetia bacterium]